MHIGVNRTHNCAQHFCCSSKPTQKSAGVFCATTHPHTTLWRRTIVVANLLTRSRRSWCRSIQFRCSSFFFIGVLQPGSVHIFLERACSEQSTICWIDLLEGARISARIRTKQRTPRRRRGLPKHWKRNRQGKLDPDRQLGTSTKPQVHLSGISGHTAVAKIKSGYTISDLVFVCLGLTP